MTHRLLLVLSIMLLGSLSTFAQDLTFGFKAGLNYSGISGPSETTASGDELEEFPFVMGFHAAAIGQYMVNEKVGFAAELLYIQKNARYRYEGDGYRVYYETGGSVPYYVEGQDKVTLGITNTYVGLPLYVIYQPIDQVRSSQPIYKMYSCQHLYLMMQHPILLERMQTSLPRMAHFIIDLMRLF